MKELWSKIELKLKVCICVFFGGIGSFLLGQIILCLPFLIYLGHSFCLFGAIATVAGCISLIVFWIHWADRR